MRRLIDMLRLQRKSRGETSAGRGVSSGVIRSAGSAESRDEYSIEVDERIFDQLYVRLAGRVFMNNAELVREDLVRAIEYQPLKNVVIDLGAVEYFDSAGAAILMEIQSVCRQLDNSLKLVHVPPRIQSFFDLVNIEQHKTSGILRPRPAPNLLTQIGDGALKFYTNATDIVTFIGAAVIALCQDLARPRHLKWDPLWKLIERSGSDAVPIVTILNFLQGAILAFQAAIQLRKFGANIFVADLVSVSICLEMGPLLTALIVSGRSGAAYAAHIGTMQVNEEIDALRVMAIDPIRYLVSPRIIAVAFVLPCLTLFADLVGILGGCAVAVLSLDLTPLSFFNQVHKVLEVSDVLKGLVKSFTFGIEIAMIGCLRGFQVRGGAENVGRATTSAVVTCIFLLTVTDAFFAALFHYFPVAWK